LWVVLLQVGWVVVRIIVKGPADAADIAEAEVVVLYWSRTWQMMAHRGDTLAGQANSAADASLRSIAVIFA
jgi:hypothetical protein